MKGMRSKREFYKSFLGIGLPLVVQQFLTSSLNFVDNVMMGRLGAEYIAGVGFANNVYKIQDICLFGICGGMGVFISQYYGKKEFGTIKKIMGSMMFFAVGLSTIIAIVASVFAKEIISMFTVDKVAFNIGVSYLRISSISYIFSAIGFSLSFSLRCIGKTKVPMLASAVGVALNAFLNYALIYGNFGFSPMNEKGAAIATIIARAVQAIMVIYLIYIYDYGIKDKLKKYLGISKMLLGEIIKLAVPIFLTEVFWVCGTVALSIAYSRLGTGEAASIQIADIVFSIAAIIFMGVSNATSVIIGKSLGSGKKKLAILHSQRSVKLAIIFSIICVVVIQMLVTPVLSLYVLSPEIYNMAYWTLRVYVMVIFFKLLNWTILIGVLRAGGDTKIAFYLDVLPLYLYAIPTAFIGLYFRIPIYILVGLVNMEEVIKLFFSVRRYISMKWVKDITV